MRKLVKQTLLVTAASFTLLLICAAHLFADAPAELNGVMLQAFYWNVPQRTDVGDWWQTLAKQAAEFSEAGFTALWLPPPYKGASGTSDMGYGVYDRYDLGEFDQKGAVATRFGTLAELKAAIQALHDKNIQVYADIVMNHMMGADANEQFDYAGQHFDVPTKFTFPGRGNKYSNYTWQYWNFNGVQQADGSWLNWHGGWDFSPYRDAWDNLMGCEIRYLDENNRNELVRWGGWLTSTLNLDGYRLDATKHMYTPFVNQWLDQVKGSRFAVSEAIFYDVGELQDYANRTGRRTSLFDFPLHKVFADTLNQNGPGDLRTFRFAGYTEADGPLSVSFVDNHDTDGSYPVVNQKMLAYAYILTRDKGYPCVFYKDYYEYGLGEQIKQLIEIRRDHAYGPSWEHQETDADVYLYSRAGDAGHTGLLLVLCDQDAPPKSVRTPFTNARLRDLTGNQPGIVTTDAAGNGTFPVKGGSYSVWSPVPASAASAIGHVAAVAHIDSAANPPSSRRAIAPQQDPFGETTDTVAFLDQNWTADESNRFYFTPQGSQLVPYDWFLALEQVDKTTLFRDNQNVQRYRYLPQSAGPLNPDGLPVGFTRDAGVGRDWLGMTCAACHTTEIHFGQVAYRVEGAPAQADVQAFLSGLIAALRQTDQDSAKFARFATRVLADNNTLAGQARLHSQLAAIIDVRVGYNLRNFPTFDSARISPVPDPQSFGRLDAVDAIVNEVFRHAVRNPDPQNPTEGAQAANAPVSYPCLWDTSRHKKVEWLGIANSGGIGGVFSLARNVGEVIGVFGDVEIPDNPSLLTLGYRSSVKMNELRELETLLDKLWSPEWPETFPAIDRDAARLGADIYAANCASCHKVIDRKDPDRVPGERMSDEHTDPQAALNFFQRIGSSGKLAGAHETTLLFSPKIPAQASADQMLRNVVIGTILGGLREPPPDQLDDVAFKPTPSSHAFALAAPRAEYKARPLNGIWATAPYLHNGSVPNLDALLRPAAQRPTSFQIGSRRFDPVRVGFQTEGGTFPRFNVNDANGNPIAGNSNSGHEWGTNLDDQSRQRLLEYLKTL